MDIRKRQEAQAVFTNIRVETKLKMRAKAIQDILWSARNPSNKIKGYDLSNCYRKYKFKVKKCWKCGSTTHLKPIVLSIDTTNSDSGYQSWRK